MASLHFPVKRGAENKQAVCYWAKGPGYSEVNLLNTWNGDGSVRSRNSAELARLAAIKWEATCEYGTVASSCEDIQRAIRTDAKAEVTAMLVAEAKWFDDQILGVCLFHRSWAGNVFLDFLAAHPATEGAVKGIGVGLLYHLCDVCCRLEVELLWGETENGSTGFYEKAFGLAGIKDQLLITHEKQETFCGDISAKWRSRR